MLRERDLSNAASEWAQSNPHFYAACPPLPPMRQRRTLTDSTVNSLAAAVRNHREHCIWLFLATLGLRAEAIAVIRITDVWDSVVPSAGGCGGSARLECSLLEKGSRRRKVFPNATLREALRCYLTMEHAGVSPLLFPGRDTVSVPVRDTANQLLAILSHRASVTPPVSAHQLRHYVVTKMISNGNSLEAVSKSYRCLCWMG